MRTNNSIKNIFISLMCNSITLIISFFAQKIFISYLGIEYSGLNSVLSNVISMLAISELGIGSAIIFNLYKPIADDDKNKIKALMEFYKKAYRYISFTILIIGLVILPFINKFVDASVINENIYIIYLLFLFDSVISYLATYKRSLIYAYQKNRIVDLIHLGYVLFTNTFQIIILINSKNYILYLIIKIIGRFLENIFIAITANKLYPYIKEKSNEKIDNNIKKDIKIRVKAQIFHTVGGYIVLGTDSLLVSKFLGLAVSGIYGNYILLINAINTILSQIFNATTASIGNLLVEKNYKKSYEVYKKSIFINFIIYGFVSIVFYFIVNDFIVIWLGNTDFLFSKTVVLFFSLNLYMQGMRRTMQTFASAAGICYENRFVPLVEAIINLIASIILLKFFGVLGVVLGTIISTFILYFYSFPKYIYEPLFKIKKTEYFKEFFKFAFIEMFCFLIIYAVDKYLICMFVIENIYFLIIKFIIICFLTLVLFVLLLFKKDEFKYFLNMIINKIHRLKMNKIRKCTK